MALYPGTEGEKRVPVALLNGAVRSIFSKIGMPNDNASLLADSLVRADQRGVHSHGTIRVPDYVEKLTKGGIDPQGQPRIVLAAGGVLVVDGGNAMGQISMAFAMKRAIELAKTTGVAFAAIGGSNHSGAMDYFAMMALQHDMIGICATNAIPTMAPWGGRDQVVGINPIGIAIPGNRGNFVLDFSFGATAHGKIRVYAQKKQPIPIDWAFDAEGRPTTDPVAAMLGLIQPIGKYKGIALGMAMGMLSTLLSGAAYGTELGNMVDGAKPGADGHFCMAINIATFQPVEKCRARVDKILAQIHNGNLAPGFDQLYTPGQIGEELEVAYARDGIPLNDETLAGIVSTGRNVGADVSALAQIAGRRKT